MVTKRILLVETGQLIGGVIRDLLASHPDYQVIGVNPSNPDEFQKAIQEDQPDVVLMDDTITIGCMSSAFQILQEFPQLRLVILCSNENRAHVYSAQHVTVTELADFYSILE